MNEKEFPTQRTATLGGVVLIDPDTRKPYKSGVTIQQIEGGFDPSGLSTEAKQEEIVSALEDVLLAVSNSRGEPQEVVITDDELPPVAGQATSTKQDQIISALANLSGILGGTLSVSPEGTVPVSITESPLPTGAATSSKQDAILAALGTLEGILLNDTLDITGTVGVNGPVSVNGSVSLSNASIAVTQSGAFSVSVPGVATSSKQDAILTALGNLLTAIQSPQPITDNGGSITVDGSVGVSGVVQVADNGGSLTVDGTVASTQSGTWNVGITGTPTVNVGNTVTISDGSGPLTVDGTVAISGTVPVTLPGTQPVSLSTVPTHPVSQSGSWTFTPTNATVLTTSPTAVSVGTTSVQLIGVQTSRRSLIIQNMGGTTVFLSFAPTAVATAPTFQVQPNGWIAIDRETWTGAVTAIRGTGSAAADVVVTVTS